MERLALAGRWALGCAILAATWASFAVGAAQAKFSDTDLARIIFFHLPCAINTPFFLLAGAIYSLRYLQTKAPGFDIKANACLEVGAILGILTLLTGMLFSKIQWGGWWDWDPRQSSFLLVEAILVSYFLLRAAIGNREKRAEVSGAYTLAAALPIMFLIFVFPRLPQVLQQSLHPSNTIMKGDLKAAYGLISFSLVTLIAIAFIWAISKRVQLGLLELEIENYGNLEISSGSASDASVVRPVRVSAQDRS